jgi:hypothetical protein
MPTASAMRTAFGRAERIARSDAMDFNQGRLGMSREPAGRPGGRGPGSRWVIMSMV